MGLLLDVRYALRLLAKSPQFTLLTCFILVGGLCVSLLAFNFIYTIAFKPLNTPEGESILTPYINRSTAPIRLSVEDIQLADPTLFNRLYAEYTYGHQQEYRLSLGTVGKDLPGLQVQPNYFHFTRTPPLLGRDFTEADSLASAANVVAISYSLWQSLFAGRESIVGESIRLNSQPYRVVAVMPKHYHFPAWSQVWLPMKRSVANAQANKSRTANLLVRLNTNISRKDANRGLADYLSDRHYQRIDNHQRETFQSTLVRHMSLPEYNSDGAGPYIFVALQGLSLAILLMACINTGNLIFARSIARQKESAIRRALGATRKRLVRQLVCEGAILTLLSSFLALLLTGWLLTVIGNVMRGISPNGLPFWWQWQLDQPTLLIALLFMLVTFVFACLLPAIRLSHMDINGVLRDGTRGALGKSAGRTSRVLVSVQVAIISIIMLAGSVSAVVIYSVINVLSAEPTERRYRADFALEQNQYADLFSQAEALANLASSLRGQAQIEAVSSLNELEANPVRLSHQHNATRIDTYATIGQLDLYNRTLLQGRDLDAGDNLNNAKVALVSDSFAQRHWPSGQVLGKMLEVELDQQFVPYQIVGVVSNAGRNSQGSFAAADKFDELYLSAYQHTSQYTSLSFRTSAQEQQGVEAFYQVVQQHQLHDALYSLFDEHGNLQIMLQITTLVAKVTLYCGGFALLMALMGVYGVAAHSVALRWNEIGIRRALGAKNSAIIGLFLRRNVKPLAIGLTVGLLVYAACGYVFIQLIGAHIYLSMYLGLPMLAFLSLSLMLGLAAYLPARDAVSREPAETLRTE